MSGRGGRWNRTVYRNVDRGVILALLLRHSNDAARSVEIFDGLAFELGHQLHELFDGRLLFRSGGRRLEAPFSQCNIPSVGCGPGERPMQATWLYNDNRQLKKF